MSATDELRRLLDERGVEWWEDAFSGEHRTVFDGKDGVRYCVYQLGSSLFISSILPVTPAQAIAATLGGEECELVYGENDHGDDGWWCQSCGEWFAASFRHTGRNNIIYPRYCQHCGKAVKR